MSRVLEGGQGLDWAVAAGINQFPVAKVVEKRRFPPLLDRNSFCWEGELPGGTVPGGPFTDGEDRDAGQE